MAQPQPFLVHLARKHGKPVLLQQSTSTIEGWVNPNLLG
ncbi:protein of unknown function [Legionella micdadei]|uniref:Uncharacterized protein n=1 Tax=Legionella micdadei TaxID=451 RepID=A0A098GIL7_LEGMI|nr:protein of unknown function [Legionella micdadei]